MPFSYIAPRDTGWYLDSLISSLQAVLQAGLLKEGMCAVQDESAGKSWTLLVDHLLFITNGIMVFKWFLLGLHADVERTIHYYALYSITLSIYPFPLDGSKSW